jgi:branched-chain amino acid transport system ATP-binding protein
MSALLTVTDVGKRFRGLVAVDRVNFEVTEGETFAIIGPNGAGKTTLFNMIAGVLAPDTGTITFAGERIDGLTSDKICRRGIGRRPAITSSSKSSFGSVASARASSSRLRSGSVREEAI